ncbi:MAG: flagellar basal body rod protein FlgC [candidate division Zixibacteria bacterium CG_4_9_14_3_um_filter_46_8]|nr:MAG: flagellar basal body rod protein FlgC [candidate division Zixibacteria bacterium CG_4_9_14_3_um_filter_46_8]
MSDIFSSFKVSSSGLSAQRRRMDAVASNIANSETTHGPDGTFYKRKRVYFAEDLKQKEFFDEFRQASVKLARTNAHHLAGISAAKREEAGISMVKANEQLDTEDNFKLVFDPTHPDADEKGYVKLPDINVIGEMVDLMVSSRAYEANIVAIDASKNMAMKALDI